MKTIDTKRERHEREGNHHIGESMAAYCQEIGRPGYWAERIRNGDGAQHWYFHCEMSDAEMKALRYAWSTEDIAKISAFLEAGGTGRLETDYSVYNFSERQVPLRRDPKGRHGVKYVTRASGTFPTR